MRELASEADLPTDVAFLQILLEEFVAGKMDMIGEMKSLTTSINTGKFDPDDLVDVGYLLRELRDHLKDLRKEVEARHDLAGKVNAIRLIKRASMDPMKAEDTIKGKIAVGVVWNKFSPRLPKRGSKEYKEAMKTLGVPDDIVEGDIFSFSWNGLTDWITSQMEQGKRLPASLSDTFPQCGMHYRRKTNRSKG